MKLNVVSGFSFVFTNKGLTKKTHYREFHNSVVGHPLLMSYVSAEIVLSYECIKTPHSTTLDRSSSSCIGPRPVSVERDVTQQGFRKSFVWGEVAMSLLSPELTRRFNSQRTL